MSGYPSSYDQVCSWYRRNGYREMDGRQVCQGNPIMM